MTPWLMMGLAVVAAYFVGAIPTGLIVGRMRGVDLRTVGSRNIGFTNAWRVLGAGPGIAVLLIDVGKAFAAAWFLPMLVPDIGESPYAKMVIGLCVMSGNLFNVFLGGLGGKGIASGLGVFLALSPKAVGIGLFLFVALVALTRYISVGSIAAATALAIGSIVWAEPPIAVAACIASAIAIIKHRENVKRLLAGTERKFGRAGSEATSAQAAEPPAGGAES